MSPPGPALVIDIGGTKLGAGVAEPAGRLVSWAQVPTPRDVDAEHLWRTLDALLTRVLDGAKVGGPAGLAGVGCGAGGPMQWPEGVVSPLNIPAWRAFPLRARLLERFAGRGVRNVLGMVVSTGVGGGLILDGRLIEGASGNAGHIGHVVVDPADGPACSCGGRGCLEAIARGAGAGALGAAGGLAAWPAGGHRQGPRRRRRARSPGRPGRDEPGRTGARNRHRLRDLPVRPGSRLGRRRPLAGRGAAVRAA